MRGARSMTVSASQRPDATARARRLRRAPERPAGARRSCAVGLPLAIAVERVVEFSISHGCIVSYSAMDPATARFSDVRRPCIGIETSSSHSARAADGQPAAFVSDHERERPVALDVGHATGRSFVEPEYPPARRLQPRRRSRSPRRLDDRDREQRPDTGPHRARIVRIGRVAQTTHACGTERVGRADQAPEVAGTARPVEHEHRTVAVDVSRGPRRDRAPTAMSSPGSSRSASCVEQRGRQLVERHGASPAASDARRPIASAGDPRR